MKKLIILNLFLCHFFSMAQNNDTVFYKDGHKLGCTILKIEDSIIYCSRYNNEKIFNGAINLIDVAKFTYGKNNTLLYEGIVKTDSTRIASDLFETAKNWFTNDLSGVTKQIKYINSLTGQINGQFSFVFISECVAPKCLRCIGPVTWNVSVTIKDGNYRYILSDFVHTGNEKAPDGAISFYKITTENICPYIKADVPDKWVNDRWSEIKMQISTKVSTLLQDLKDMMSYTAPGSKW